MTHTFVNKPKVIFDLEDIVDDAKKQIVVLALIHAYNNFKDYSNI